MLAGLAKEHGDIGVAYIFEGCVGGCWAFREGVALDEEVLVELEEVEGDDSVVTSEKQDDGGVGGGKVFSCVEEEEEEQVEVFSDAVSAERRARRLSRSTVRYALLI